MDKGEQVYASQCATCHQADGQGLPPAFPALAGSPIATGSLEEHLRVVLEGREGTAMQAFEDTLTPSDIAAAITYTRNAFGNETGDLVQPATIADATKG
jgi:cytochrome c oxidase subunit 2